MRGYRWVVHHRHMIQYFDVFVVTSYEDVFVVTGYADVFVDTRYADRCHHAPRIPAFRNDDFPADGLPTLCDREQWSCE